MQSIQKMIQCTGGFAQLCQEPLNVEHPPFQPLSIKHTGPGPRQLPTILVTQDFECHGTQNFDSEMEFEVRLLSAESWLWLPVSFRQAEAPLFLLAAWTEFEGDLAFDKEAADGLTLIAESWDEVLILRGYPGAGGTD